VRLELTRVDGLVEPCHEELERVLGCAGRIERRGRGGEAGERTKTVSQGFQEEKAVTIRAR
jgi:hypothetical protein